MFFGRQRFYAIRPITFHNCSRAPVDLERDWPDDVQSSSSERHRTRGTSTEYTLRFNIQYFMTVIAICIWAQQSSKLCQKYQKCCMPWMQKNKIEMSGSRCIFRADVSRCTFHLRSMQVRFQWNLNSIGSHFCFGFDTCGKETWLLLHEPPTAHCCLVSRSISDHHS